MSYLSCGCCDIDGERQPVSQTTICSASAPAKESEAKGPQVAHTVTLGFIRGSGDLITAADATEVQIAESDCLGVSVLDDECLNGTHALPVIWETSIIAITANLLRHRICCRNPLGHEPRHHRSGDDKHGPACQANWAIPHLYLVTRSGQS